jgi:hypothetical protein
VPREGATRKPLCLAWRVLRSLLPRSFLRNELRALRRAASSSQATAGGAALRSQNEKKPRRVGRGKAWT